MLQIKCPKCEHIENVEDSRSGEAVTCSECGNVSMAPSVGATPPAGEAPASPVPPQVQVAPKDPEKDPRMWGMFCHLAALSGFLGIPLGWILGPLVVWLIKKEDYPFVDQQGKESINFQISMTIYMFASAVLIFVLVGFLLLPALVIFDIVMVILATIKANEGKSFRYPLTIRFLK